MERIVLNNGLRLLLLPQPEARVFTLDVWVGAGSRYEAGFHGGISHLTEHMLFKGTATRTSRDISLAVDDIGGVINAYTGQEHTRYYIKTLGEFAVQALTLLADMLQGATIPQRELELEKQVVLEEIAMYEDSPEDVAHDGLTEMVWQGSALGASISGTRESVIAIDREEVLRFLAQQYTPDNMLVVCAGGFDVAAVRAAVEATFGSRPAGDGHPTDETPTFVSGILRRVKPHEQVCLEVGFPGLPVDAPERFTLTLMTALLGDGESSRLYQRLREELGLVYGVFTTHYACQGTGIYTIAASTSPDNQLTVLSEIGAVLTRFLTEEITPEELRRTKTRVKTGFLMSLETVAAYAAREGRCEWVLGYNIPVEQVLAAWDAVTPKDIIALARRPFSGPVALAAVGPAAEEAELRRVLDTYPGAKFGAC